MPATAAGAGGMAGDQYAAERQLLLDAQQRGVVYVMGRSHLRPEPGSSWFKVRAGAWRERPLWQAAGCRALLV